MNVHGKGVLITGASQGLGAALSKCLARQGAKVVMVARGHELLERTAGEIRAEGGEAHALSADVSHKDAVHAIAGAAAALVGPIEVVVHNASTLGAVPMPLLLDTDCEDVEAVLATNVVGPFRLTKILAGAMAIHGSGLVITISSDAAVSAYPGWGAYGMSKAALDHMARIWGEEMKDTGVQFLSVDPGEMNTRMHRDAMPDADPSTLADPAEVASRIARIIQEAESIPTGSRLEAARTPVLAGVAS